MDNKELAMMFKALGDENRIQILRLLSSGERCACMLLKEMNITQPTLSHHMKILCDSGIVNGSKEGKWMHYSISKEGAKQVEEQFQQLAGRSKSTEKKSCCQK